MFSSSPPNTPHDAGYACCMSVPNENGSVFAPTQSRPASHLARADFRFSWPECMGRWRLWSFWGWFSLQGCLYKRYLLVILCVSLLRLERAAFYLFRLFCLCSSSLRRLIPWRLPLLTPQRKNTIILSIAVKECPNGRTNTIALIFALHMPIVNGFWYHLM